MPALKKISAAKEAMERISPEAQVIDDAFVKQNSRWCQFCDATSNKHGYKLTVDGASALMDTAEAYKPQSRFEELWRNNMLHELEVQEMLAHQYHGKPRIAIPELLDNACGPGTYGLLEQAFTEYDHESEWKQHEEAQNHGKKRVPNNTDEARQAIKEYVPVMKNELYAHGVKTGFIPDGFEIAIDLGEGRAFWNTELKRFYLGRETFACELSGTKVKVIPVGAYRTAFHEVFGHGSQQVNSEELPQSLRMTAKNVRNISSRVVYEGLAVQRGFLSFEWMRANADRLDINPDEIDIYEKYENSALRYPQQNVVLGILQERRKWEGLDIDAYLSQIENNPRVVWRFSDPANSGFTGIVGNLLPITSAVYELCYPAGYRCVRSVVSQFSDADSRRLNAALTTGVWSWKVCPEAVEYFLNGQK